MFDDPTTATHDVVLDYRRFTEWQLGTKHWNAGDRGTTCLFSAGGLCPFCNVRAPCLVYDADQQGDGTDYLRYIVEVRVCSCGWWEVLDGQHCDCYGDFADWGIVRSAILRVFDACDRDLPIDALRSAVAKRPDVLYGIHASKMEELVGSVFSEYFSCEVALCGRSHDGGFDLVLVDADCPTLVQVKRRQNPQKVETVSEVRHLLGATQLAGATACAYVTTSDHFSREAQRAASAAIERRLVQRYDLFDVHRFVDVLRLTTSPNSRNWRSALSPRWSGRPWA